MMMRLFLSLLLMAAAPAVARDVSGSLIHTARVALPDNAELLVQLAGEDGPVTELREAAGGRQVPLPFALTVQDEGPLTLAAAIFVNGQPLWTSAAVLIPAGDEDVALGEILMTREVAADSLMRLHCGTTQVEVVMVGTNARLRVKGQLFDLSPLPAASGLRFGDGMDPPTEFRSKGDRAMVIIAGKTLPECGPASPPALLPLTARGNEPGWVVTLSDDGMALSVETGLRLTVPLPLAQRSGAGIRFDGGALVVTVTDGICHDSMTGMPYPQIVALEQDGQILQGCGGDPAALLEGRWRLLRAGEATLPEGAEILFGGNRVSGRAVCNRFSGGATLTGEGLVFGAMATTRMACPGGSMQVEAATLGAFGKVDRFDISEQGHLLLMAGDRVLIEAAR